MELKEAGGQTIYKLDDELTTVQLNSQESLKSGPEASGFTFDRVFDIETKQPEVFDYGVRGIVDGLFSLFFLLVSFYSSLLTLLCFVPGSDVINGYNGTVFAYGQTGSVCLLQSKCLRS